MRILFSIICFNIFFLIRGYSQELRTITVNDGLSSMIVRNIAQSDNGLIWIATQCGIQSYNGTFFKQYDVFDMRVRSWILLLKLFLSLIKRILL